jgi:hypothetical protein
MSLTLDELLDEARNLQNRPVPNTPLSRRNCLSFAVLRKLALQPGETSSTEDAHLATCSACASRLQICRQEMPHLPWWTLVRYQRSQLTAEEDRVVQYHLREGECSICQNRLHAFKQQGYAVLKFPVAAASIALAAEINQELIAYAPRGEYEIEVFSATPRLQCEIRTRNQQLRNYLFAVVCDCDVPNRLPLTGYTILTSSLNGWLSGCVSIDHPQYPPGTTRASTYAVAMEADALTSIEVDQLLTSLSVPLSDLSLRNDWRQWLARVRPQLQRADSAASNRLVADLEIWLSN